MRCTRHQCGHEWCGSATKNNSAPHRQPVADGVGKRLLLPYRLSGREKSLAGIRNYRVDRMSSVTVLGDAAPGQGRVPPVRPAQLSAQAFQHVRRAGIPGDPALHRRPETPCGTALLAKTPLFMPGGRRCIFHFDVPICVSPQFFGWICGFGGKVEITAPRRRPRSACTRWPKNCGDASITEKKRPLPIGWSRSFSIFFPYSSNSRSPGWMRSRGAAGSATRRRLWLKMAFSSVLRARRPLPAVRLSSA